MYTIDEIKELKPMLYWAFPPNSSANQKKRFAKAMETNYILTLKRDGALYRAVIEEDSVILQSRTISKKTGVFVEKQDNVPAIIEALKKLPPNTVLMGEICFPLSFGNTISSDVITVMGCKPDKAISRQKQTPLSYYIFDVLMYDGEPFYNKPYKIRAKKLEDLQTVLRGEENIEFAQPVYEDIEETIANYLNNGWEGGVLMKADEPYHFEKRPAWSSIKVKQSSDTIDLVIMGTTPPMKEYTGKYPVSHQYWESVKTGQLVEGSYYSDGGYTPVSINYFRGMIGGLSLGAYYNDRLIEVAKVANLTDDIREAITADPESYIGQVVEVGAMMVDVEKKSLRHPKLLKIRPDKNAEDCVYTEIFK